MWSASIAVLEISIASVVLPVPKSPVNHMPRPAATWSEIASQYSRTSRSTCGYVRCSDGTGSRSNETSRNAFGTRPATAAARLRASRCGRHEHGNARRVSSS